MNDDAEIAGVGEVLADRYELREQLGSGGMGVVFGAFDRELEEEIALKLLHRHAPPEAVQMLRREVRLARRVTHPNVARTFDLAVAGEHRFITMELVRGQPLATRVAGGAKLPLGEVLRIGAAVARGLVAAHEVGVVHRDLKPGNVLLASARTVITDFGIAWAPSDDGTSGPPSRVAGTPSYMAPEQLMGAEVDGRTDVYALGVMLFRMLTGRMPFVGSIGEQVRARMSGAVPEPRDVDATLPAPLAALVMEALEPDRKKRLDASELVRRIDAVRGDVAASPAHEAEAAVEAAPASVSATVVDRTPLASRGPAHPEARELYDQAMREGLFEPVRLENRVSLLEAALEMTPDDPWVLSALAAALARAWNLGIRPAPDVLTRSEDLAVRALSLDPTNGQTFETLGFLRMMNNEGRAAARALTAALARDAGLYEAGFHLAMLTSECGDFETAGTLLDRAEENGLPPWRSHDVRARVAALQGDKEESYRQLARVAALGEGVTSPSAVFVRMRLALWFGDDEVFADAARRLAEAVNDGRMRRGYAVTRIAEMVAKRHELPASARVVLDELDPHRTILLRIRIWLAQVVAEVYASVGKDEEAVAAAAHAVDLGLMDIAWMDHCPPLEVARGHPEMTRLRTLVAARASSTWPL